MLNDAEFLERFDAGTLDPATFDHTSHVRVAWLCLRRAPFHDAIGRVRRGLELLTIAAGTPQRYHETITVAYARLIDRQMRGIGPDAGWEEFQVLSPDLFAPGGAAVKALYPPDVLESVEARTSFVPPPAWDIEPAG